MRKNAGEIKVKNPDISNLPLTGYYQTLPNATRRIIVAPKDEFLDEIAKVTGRTRETVRRWCLGEITPPAHVRERIAKHFKTTPESLFPETA